MHAAAVDAPLVVTHHGNDQYVPTGSPIKRAADYFYANVLLDPILRITDRITLPSLAYLRSSSRLSRYEDKITEIPNGIYPEQYDRPDLAERANKKFGLSPADDLVFFVGNLIPKKGPDLLVEAAKNLPEGTRVVIAGSGPLLETLRNRSPEMVSLPGYVSEDDKIALYNRADVFCLPSRTRTEVFPLVVLEAYASRTPVVASDLETFDPFVKSDTDRRFESENIGALRAVIENLLSSEEDRSRLGQNARRTAQSYQWEEIVTEYETLFQTVIGKLE
jgi:glycosyltransferase involved in cell wall biosynthesis